MIDDLSAMVRRKLLLVGAGLAVCVAAVLALVVVCRDRGSPPRSPPDDGGPRGRRCITFGEPPVPPGAQAELRHLHWAAVISDAGTGATLGVIAVDATYAVSAGDSHGRRACVETLGVPRSLAVVPALAGVPLAPAGEPVRLQLTLDVAIRGPARREDGRLLAAPEAGVQWRFEVRASGVTVARASPAGEPRLRPPWDGVVLAIRDGEPDVESIAVR